MKWQKSLSMDQRRSVTFYKYFFSYVIIIVILQLIVGSAVYGSFITSMQKAVKAANTSSLSQIKDMMDSRLREMERITYQISTNGRLTPSMTGNQGYDFLQANKELKNYNSGNAFVYDMALYYMNKSKDTVYASSGIYDLEYFLNTEYAFDTLNKESFITTVSSLKSPMMRPVEETSIRNFKKSSFALYLFPMPVGSEKPYGVVTYLIEEKELRAMIGNIVKEYNGYIYILDQDNQIIVSVNSDKMKYEKKEILNFINISSLSQGVSSVYINDEDYSVVKVPSEYNRWSYVTVMPTKQFMQSVDKSRKVFLYIVVLVSLLGILLAFFFATYNYKPWKRLMRFLQGQDSNNIKIYTEKNDEIDYIIGAVNKVTNENRNLMTKLRSKSGMIKDQILFMLLKGKFENRENMDSFLEMSEMKFDKSKFVVLLFLIDDYQRFTKENKKPIQDLLKFSIINIIEELSTEIGNGYGLDLLDEGGIALIMNLADGEYVHLKDLGERAKDFFKQNFGFSLTVGVGEIFEDILDIQKSFDQSARAADYRMVKGSDSVIFYSELNEKTAHSQYRYPIELENVLVIIIKQGRINEVEKVIKEIIKDIASQHIPPEIVQLICSGIINTVLRILDEIGMSFDTKQKKEAVELLTRNFETVESLESRMVDFGRKICMYVENSKESRNFNLRDKIIDYVKVNYSDPNLCLNSIAFMFSVTPSYITRYFKDQTGYPLIQYVDMLRLEKAKELLKESDLRLKELVLKIGYVDETNFIRKFKKSEGITPIQYRNLVRYGKNN